MGMLNKAVIHLQTLRQNALAVKAGLKDGARFNAVVKANAYGHGDVECANALYDVADSFSVALAEEGVRLRRAGVDKPILVLVEPFISDAPLFARYNLTASVSSMKTLGVLNAAARERNAVVSVHIKVNTGMNRLGADIDGAEALAANIGRFKHLKLEGIYSHFAAPEEKAVLFAQRDAFLLAYNRVKLYNKDIIAHISASGGYLAGEHFDMCRVGILLYGYSPFYSDRVRVEPVMSVKAPVVAVRPLKAGERLLYGAEPLKKDCTASVFRYGYADGLPRKKSGALLNNRCMDLSAAEGAFEEIDVLENLEEKARECGTITYELLCGAANRCERVYIR
ncbi:MAG: alanine racemase [Bacillota bacterium]|nr:MAG: alanine racemase [Bacillota bacterium]